MAFIQGDKSTGARTFQELPSTYITIIAAQLSNTNCSAIHLVFKQYFNTSFNAGVRSRRGYSDAREVRITAALTRIKVSDR